jgi:hypothetical protein
LIGETFLSDNGGGFRGDGNCLNCLDCLVDTIG